VKYPVKAASGDAGEYFFAYKIASVLTWPCRLIDIDIGIDAQVEVINDDRISTGRFVAFQVKASSADEPNCRYVTKEQLNYWRDLGLPVFVVLVDLPKEQMYFHRVSFDREYPETEKGAVRIDFDRALDLFTADSGKQIAAASEEALLQMKEYLDSVREGVTSIRDAIEGMELNPNPRLLIEVMHTRSDLRMSLGQAEALVSALKAGDGEFCKVSAMLEAVLDDLSEAMRRWNIVADYDFDGEIKKFISERR